MDRLLNVYTALSLGYVVSMLAAAAHVSSKLLVPSSCSLKTHLVFLLLVFDCMCHLTLEGAFLYLSTPSRIVNAFLLFFGYLWHEYAAADARWGTAHAALVSVELATVLVAGPLAGYCAWLMAKADKTYHDSAVVLSARELYGGWITFAPEWLTRSIGLETRDWLLLWVFVPLCLMADRYTAIARSLGESKIQDSTVASVKKTTNSKRETKASVSMTKALVSTRGFSASAYLLLLAAIFPHIMPSASASSTRPSISSGTYDPSGTTTIFPAERAERLFATLKSTLLPLLLPIFLVSFSLLVGAVQVADKALRRVRKTNRTRRRKILSSLCIDEKTCSPRTIIGFFHPYCNAGGGGERVLYEAISLHLSLDPNCVIVIYTGDYPAASKSDILAKAASRFGIRIDEHRVAMIGLQRRWMVEDSAWKSCTLLAQSYGSVWLGFEALSQLLPDVYVDTMGYAFTYPVVRLFDRKIPIGAYVHYPMISTDMLRRVEKRQAGHTNQAATANSAVRSAVKLTYYRVFARLYSWALGCADGLVANGSWTAAHLAQLLGRKQSGVKVVYPPCDTQQMVGFSLENRSPTIVSLAQFRPEKEHPTQLHILKRLRDTHPHLFTGNRPVRLVLMGSSRNADDEKRIMLLRALATQLGLDPYVEFLVNASFPTILDRLGSASVGISTMKDEHFGINVVEFMACGLITLCHKSAGPYLDIVSPSANHPPTSQAVQPTGYHAESVDEFANVLAHVFDQHETRPEFLANMRQAARERAQSVFGRHAFIRSWQSQLWDTLQLRLDANRPSSKLDKKRN